MDTDSIATNMHTEHSAAEPQLNRPGGTGKGMNGKGMKAGKTMSHSFAVRSLASFHPDCCGHPPAATQWLARARSPGPQRGFTFREFLSLLPKQLKSHPMGEGTKPPMPQKRSIKRRTGAAPVSMLSLAVD